MKFLLIGHTLAVCVLICGCQPESETGTSTYNIKNFVFGEQTLKDGVAISYCRDMKLLYNEDFNFNPQEDLKIFSGKIRTHRTSKSKPAKLDGASICKAIWTIPIDLPGEFTQKTPYHTSLLVAKSAP